VHDEEKLIKYLPNAVSSDLEVPTEGTTEGDTEVEEDTGMEAHPDTE
jgi:hypothetical protein